MCANENDDSQESQGVPVREIDNKTIEDFASEYLSAYRDYISGKDMDERHYPRFYKDFPFVVEVYTLPNRAICALFSKSNRSRFSVQDGDFEEVMDKVRNQSFDFLQTFPPFTRMDSDEAGRMAIVDAERDLKSVRRLELLADAEMHIKDIHEDMRTMVELNPWLDQQTEEQKQKLGRARELIEELFREVELSKEERFAEYSHRIMELMAFEGADMEEVAGELEIRLEEAMEEIDQRFMAMDKYVREHEHEGSVPEIQEEVKELGKTVREVKLQLKDMARLDLSEDIENELSKVQSQVNKSDKAIGDLKKEITSIKGDLAISKEIKETVFRDSKRAHNLNERTSELEKDIKELKKQLAKGTSASDIKALEGKLNVLEKSLKEYARDYTKRTVKKEIDKLPKVETEPPKGATVKKTTTKTTTKAKKKK